MLGRRIYLLVALTPFATLSEGLGIALLMPLFTALDGGEAAGAGGASGSRTLDWLPLPESPAVLLVLIAVAFFFKAMLKMTTDGLRAWMQAALSRQLRLRVMQEYADLSYLSFAQQNTGHYVNIATAQVSRFALAFGAIFTFLTQTAAALVYLAIVAVVNWQFAAVALLVGLVFVFSMRALSGYVAQISRDTALEKTTLNKQLVQVVHSLKYLVATSRTASMIDRIRESCDRLFRFHVHTGLANAFSTSIREPLSVTVVVILIGVQVYIFHEPVAAILVTLLLLDRGTKAILTVQNSWQRVAELMGSVMVVQDELKFTREHAGPRGSVQVPVMQTAVEFCDVSFAYDAEHGNVLDSINLVFPRNQTVAVVGRSGAGKSTVADLLTLMLRPSSGHVRIDDVDSSEADPGSWRRQLGYVCQETVVYDESIATNICLDAAAYAADPDVRHQVHAAARQAFASEFIEAMPESFDTIVGDRGVRLSGGQRQRLFIARELYKQPELLILDEATSALDGESESAIQASIDALRGQMTVVVIAHRLATIRNADYIYVLDNGRVVEEGSYEELHQAADSKFRQMVELQSL